MVTAKRQREPPHHSSSAHPNSSPPRAGKKNTAKTAAREYACDAAPSPPPPPLCRKPSSLKSEPDLGCPFRRGWFSMLSRLSRRYPKKPLRVVQPAYLTCASLVLSRGRAPYAAARRCSTAGAAIGPLFEDSCAVCTPRPSCGEL